MESFVIWEYRKGENARTEQFGLRNGVSEKRGKGKSGRGGGSIKNNNKFRVHSCKQDISGLVPKMLGKRSITRYYAYVQFDVQLGMRLIARSSERNRKDR